jgi:hypothetical protein
VTGRAGRLAGTGFLARAAVVAAILAASLVAYVGLLRQFGASENAGERQFGAAAPAAQVEIYIEALSIDPVNHEMQARVSLTPGPALRGDLATAPNRDLILVLSHGRAIQEIRFPANEPAPRATVEVTLRRGEVSSYPLDRYHADLGLRCLEKPLSAGGEARVLPTVVTVWEALLGFRIETAGEPASKNGEVHVGFDIRRSGAFIVFALAAYAAMVVLALCALTAGILAFIRVRRAEPTLVGALGAIVFTLPALRNILPGAPPLGVNIDLFVFLWSELAATIALGLLVYTWARTGPAP